MEARDEDPAQAVRRLMAERDDLHRRLAGVDAQLDHLASAQRDELGQRLSRLENAVALLTRSLGVGAPAPAAVQHLLAGATAPQPVAVPTGVGAAEHPPTPPAPPPPQGPPPQAAPQRPRVVGERFTFGDLALRAAPTSDAAVLGWVPAGTRVFITDAASAGRNQIVYQDRVAWVESRGLSLVPVGRAASAVQTPAQPGAAPHPPAGPPRPPTGGPLAPTRPAVTAKPPVWQRPGFVARVLALAGAAVTLIGVALLLVLATQYGLFGPEAQTISAAGLAAVLIGLAFLVRRRDERNFGAPILAATGVAAAYLSVVAATVIYHWLPPVAGTVLAALIGLGGMALARLWSNQWLALISVLGSLVLAAYIGADEPVITAALLVAMTGVTLWVEIGTGWRLFPFARVLPTAAVLIWLSQGLVPLVSDQVPWLVGLATALALLGLVSALLTPAEPPVGQAITLGLLVPTVLPASLAPDLLGDHLAAAGILGLIALAYGVLGFLPVVHERVRWATVPIGAAFALLGALTATEQRYLGVLTLALACVYLAVAARTRSMTNLIVGGTLAAVGVVAWLPLLLFSLDQTAARAAGPEQIAQSLVGIAVVVLAGLAANRWLGPPKPWLIYLTWSASAAMGSVAIIHAGTWLGTWAGNPSAGFQAGQAIVTSAWMVLCILFLRRGLASKHNEDVWLRLALVIAALAVAKLFLLDLGMLDAIARVGAFLAVGLLLLFVGTRYARAWERAHGDTAAPVAPAAAPTAPASAMPGPHPASPVPPGNRPAPSPPTFQRPQGPPSPPTGPPPARSAPPTGPPPGPPVPPGPIAHS